MECNVCLNEWDEQKCIPRMLPCGHSFCGDCLLLLFKPSSKELTCPKCLLPHKADNVDKLDKLFPKNWALIALADSHKPTAPLLQMKKGMHSARHSMTSTQIFQSLGASSVQLVWARTRGNSDQLHSSSSRKFSNDVDEECKSEDEIKRVVESDDELTDEESDEESKVMSNSERLQAPKGKGRNKGVSVLKKEKHKNLCSQDGGEAEGDSDGADGYEGEDL